MFLVDDILLFPVNSLFWILREINNAAHQELANEGDAITARLTELYMQLETNQITEEEFDSIERELLDRLDELRAEDGDDETLSDDPDEPGPLGYESEDSDGVMSRRTRTVSFPAK